MQIWIEPTSREPRDRNQATGGENLQGEEGGCQGGGDHWELCVRRVQERWGGQDAGWSGEVCPEDLWGVHWKEWGQHQHHWHAQTYWAQDGDTHTGAGGPQPEEGKLLAIRVQQQAVCLA